MSNAPDRDLQKLIRIEQRLNSERKSSAFAFFLWRYFGGFGAHRLYLGQRIGLPIALEALFGIGLITISMPFAIALNSDGFLYVAFFGGAGMTIHAVFRMFRDGAHLPQHLAKDDARRRTAIAAEIDQSPPDDLSLQNMPASVMDQERLLTELRLANTRKSTKTAFLLWAELGRFGAHYFYLGRQSEGMSRAGMWIAGWLITFAGLCLAMMNSMRFIQTPHWVIYMVLGIGIPCLALAGILRVIDLFRLPGLVQANNDVRRRRMKSETINGVKRF